MAKEGSVAPKERVNIRYKPAIGDAQEEIELPLKLMMMGDFTLQEDERDIEDRKPINIDKDNFTEVMKAMNLSLSINVPNKLSEKEGDELPVHLKFDSLKNFEPESIANQVTELRQLLELRTALVALKNPLGNMPAFRKKIEALLKDKTSRDRLLSQVKTIEE
jgi:type VI secretion system protein ImpB